VPSIPAAHREAFEAYLAGPSRIREAVTGLDQTRLSQRPAGSEWSVRDVIIHLSDAELVRAERLRRIVAEESPELRPFDQDLWKRRLAYLWRDPELALTLLELLCHANAELLRQLDAAGWERSGLHPEFGPMTVGRLVRLGADHFADHAAHIRALRNALAETPRA
jgi:hypothetical protein